MTEAEPAGAASGAESSDAGAWVVVIPVKPAKVGKTRLADARLDRVALARAIALDTIAAAASATRVIEVIVVTDDADVAAEAAAIDRVRVMSENAAGGLNAAIAVGIAATGDHRNRAALLGDLPALRPGDLSRALAAAASVDRAVVADAEGLGSTLVTASAGIPWSSAFGEDSFSRHRAVGCVPLELADASTLRRDVDTVAQLDEARVLGVGPRTAGLSPR